VPIETKLHAPGVRPEWVERPALIGCLAQTTTSLVLVDAPAGFGKTTVVAQWLHGDPESRAFAWLSLDHGDDDPARLWWYVVSALRRACPGIGLDDIATELRKRTPDVIDQTLPVLANQLATFSKPVVLVLDDYHVIKERAIHEQVAFLLPHLPPNAQVVLITRADPPLPLARMRAEGEMMELRARDLRFTQPEAAQLLRAVCAVQLDESDLGDLMERTEGWPAGVYLAALSLRGHPSPRDFVRQFSGDNRFIVDFLAEEVLSRQSAEVQRFLARTSVLTRFCAPLCQAVTGCGDPAEMIDRLERENLFLVPLDDTRRWYRYHHLFAHVLRSRLAGTEPDVVVSLHERASAWHEQTGTAEEAISHALAAGDVARSVDLVARHWRTLLDSGGTAMVRGWMRSLSDEAIAGIPLAAHVAAWTAALSGDREAVFRWLPVMEAADDEGPLPDGMRSLKSSAALLRGVNGFEGLKVMRDSAALAAELEDDATSPWHALAASALGFSRYLSGDIAAAAAALEDAVQSDASIPVVRMVALSLLAQVAVRQGRLAKARELAEAARAIADASDACHAPQGALAYTAMGAVYAALGRPEAAKEELEQALESRHRVFGISPWPTFEAMLTQARVLLDLGDRGAAAELAAEARDRLIALPDGTEDLQSRLAEVESRIARERAPVGPVAEQLTERETVVLRLLAGTLSLREIARELYVSANTVKTHTRAIYRKLGVTTRQDAVERARRLGVR
jgi:LuxR family maltose regulon positive regulatory protein